MNVGLGEFLCRFGLVLDTDAEHFHLAFVGGAELDQFRDFSAAWGAPASPEIDDQWLALVVLQGHRLVVEIVERGDEERFRRGQFICYGQPEKKAKNEKRKPLFQGRSPRQKII